MKTHLCLNLPTRSEDSGWFSGSHVQDWLPVGVRCCCGVTPRGNEAPRRLPSMWKQTLACALLPTGWRKTHGQISWPPLAPFHAGVPACLVWQWLTGAWIYSGHHSPLLTSSLHQTLALAIQDWEGRVSQGISSRMWPGEPWRCDAGAPSWGPLVPALVLDTQQPHSRRILLKAGWGRQPIILVCSYTKGTLTPLWILELPFWDSAKDMWGLPTGHKRMLLPLVSHLAHLSFQHRQQLWSHCHSRNPASCPGYVSRPVRGVNLLQTGTVLP